MRHIIKKILIVILIILIFIFIIAALSNKLSSKNQAVIDTAREQACKDYPEYEFEFIAITYNLNAQSYSVTLRPKHTNGVIGVTYRVTPLLYDNSLYFAKKTGGLNINELEKD